MSRRVDVVTTAIAVVLHAGIGVAMLRDAGKSRAKPRPIEVEFRRPKPPAPALPPRNLPPPIEPVHAARAPRRKLALAERPPAPVAAAPTPAPRPAPPAPPVFGIAMDSPTAADSPVSAPVGGTTRADPGARRAARGGDPRGVAGGEPGGAAPVSELEIKTMPEIDTDACGKTVSYPEDAARSGVQGDVRLRVTLDDKGHVRAAHVLSGLGHGLDQAAVEALTRHCRFTPAIAKDGRAVPFVVESYTFHFELPR